METCVQCKRDFSKIYNKKRQLCRKCADSNYRKTKPKEICHCCEKLRDVNKRIDNKPTCSACDRKHFRKKCECSRCGKEKRIEKRIDGKPFCQLCYNDLYRPKHICDCCGKEKNVEKRIEDKKICKNCYGKHYMPKHICKDCGELKTIKGHGRCDNCYMKHKKNTNEHFSIMMRLRNRLLAAFKDYSTTGKTKHADEYGIDYEAIIKRLGPCPGAREDYHIDHIKPLILFNFDDLEQIKIAFAPENHQWLTKEENLSKGDSYET